MSEAPIDLFNEHHVHLCVKLLDDWLLQRPGYANILVTQIIDVFGDDLENQGPTVSVGILEIQQVLLEDHVQGVHLLFLLHPIDPSILWFGM